MVNLNIASDMQKHRYLLGSSPQHYVVTRPRAGAVAKYCKFVMIVSVYLSSVCVFSRLRA